MSLKRILQDRVFNPAAIARGETYTKLAKVIKADEENNTCTIEYKDKDAMIQQVDSVHVKIYNIAFQDWFPKPGDIVEIEESGGIPVITGLPGYAYNANIRIQNELLEDIYSDELTCDTLGGYVF
jgi:hypothetical protein